jgi:hypothetical protein
MNAIILGCGSLSGHIDMAQSKMNTSHPVVCVDRSYHSEPKEMRLQLIQTMEHLSREVDTVLVAMGFCGGSWDSISVNKRIVIPRVDDCITLLLHTNNTWHPNLKKAGHIYLRDSDTGAHSLESMQKRLCEKYGMENGISIFDSWFATYTNVDVIDTGIYDCHAKDYVAQARRDADLIHCCLDYVPGSNLLLEKLVSGSWDEQFLIAEPGRMLSNQDFVKPDGNFTGTANR